MLKKILVSLILVLISFNYTTEYIPASSLHRKKPSLIFLSIGVDYLTLEGKEDVFAQEAQYIERSIENSCGRMYNIKSKYFHSDDATNKNFLKGMKWAVKSAKENDLIIVYIGAHGSGNEDGEYEFYTADDTIVSKDLIDNFSKTKANVLILVDTCHSGAIIRDWKNPGKNISILTACEAEERAYIWNFVIPFSESLAVADYNKDNFINIAEVSKYVSENMCSDQSAVFVNNIEVFLCKTDQGFLLFFYESRTKIMNTIADVLREKIRNTGKSVFKISRESGVAQPVLSRFMSGKRSVNLETVEKLCAYFNLILVHKNTEEV